MEGQLPVVYSFFPNISPGYIIVELQNNLVSVLISMAGNICSMRVWLTDQGDNQLNLQGEIVMIRFRIRSIENVHI